MAALSRIEKNSVSNQVFDMLKSEIIHGKWKAGERIPSENELTHILGCSRPPIKAAVERLRAIGLIEVRAGDGSYVRNFSTSDFLDTYADFIMSEGDIRNLMEFRSALELEALPYILQRATPEDLAELERIAGELADAFRRKDYDQGAQCDFAFHLQLCKCSGNPYFSQMYELVGNLVFRQLLERTDKVHRRNSRAFLFDDHVQIFNALREKDLARARELLEIHIMNRDNHMEKLANMGK